MGKKKAVCPKHCNTNKGAFERNKDACTQVPATIAAPWVNGKVQGSNTTGNWAAQEFEAKRLVCLAARFHNSSWKFLSFRRAAWLPRSRCLWAAFATLAACVFQECEKLAQWGLWFSQDDVLGHDWS